MHKTTWTNLRQQSQWLTLVASFAIMASTISLTLLCPSGRSVLANGRGGTLRSVFGVYQGPQQCGDCHQGELLAWSGTAHAEATFDPIFQIYLQREEESGECFTCHTPGDNALTGQFVTAGVTCEACHGPYRPGHPGESMAIASAVDLCSTCHRSTRYEWEASRHGQEGVTCVACHEVHTQRTRGVESTDALCVDCHTGDRSPQGEIHTTHQAAAVRCIDCHLARPVDRASTAANGHAVTAHSFTVAVTTCNQCHSESVH